MRNKLNKIEGKNGYLISCKEWEVDNPKQIIVACHGFAGDKDSSAISMLAESLTLEGIGTVAFDLPGHGESEVSGDELTIDNCLSDFISVIEYVKNSYPDSKISIFATSFGAYLTLLLLNKNVVDLEKVILRCPAIKIDEILVDEIIRDKMGVLEEQGYIIVGYERELKLNYGFYLELKNLRIFDIYQSEFSEILIIHGDEDTTAPIIDSIDFANKYGVALEIIKGADHRFKKPGELEQVVYHAINFIKK